jgi:hypothetical protein
LPIDSDNIVSFPGTTHVGIDNDDPIVNVDDVIDGIKANNVSEVFVVGLDENDDLYLASNIPSLSKFVYILEIAKLKLLNAEFVHE